MKFKDGQAGDGMGDDLDGDINADLESSNNLSTKAKQGKPNLLQTYLNIVKTGAPEEIERFS